MQLHKPAIIKRGRSSHFLQHHRLTDPTEFKSLPSAGHQSPIYPAFYNVYILEASDLNSGYPDNVQPMWMIECSKITEWVDTAENLLICTQEEAA